MALGVAPILGVPTAYAAEPETSSTETDLVVSAKARTTRSSEPVIQGEAEVPHDVGVVAVVADQADAPESVKIRTTTAGEAGSWEEVGIEGEVDAEGRVSTEPMIVTDVDSVEAIATGGSAARLVVFSSTVTAVDAAASDLAWKKPAIRSRQAWRADESLVRHDYSMGKVTGAMIHHTAGSNSYSSSEVPAILRSIQAYHVNGRGWNDIAYNVLIDRFGRAWQGRGGAINTPVAGGHAWGVTNSRVVGVALMGSYQSASPSADTLETLSQVIAWKLQMHRVDPYGRTWGSGGMDGGATRLDAISGHQDEYATLCPGAKVYEKLDSIRARVAKLMDSVDYPGMWDIPAGYKYQKHIEWLEAAGITNGYSDGSFRSSKAVTRGSAAAFFYRLAGSPSVKLPAASPFEDVSPSHKFYKEIVWMEQSGVARGHSDGTYRPSAKVSRGTMSVFLYRYYDGSTPKSLSHFTDLPSTSKYARTAGWGAEAGILKPSGSGTFRPKTTLTRRALAVFFYRAEH